VLQGLTPRRAIGGAQPAGNATIAAALLWTLAQGLVDGFTLPANAAWNEPYTIYATAMKDAAA
jgi:hypothetical protein